MRGLHALTGLRPTYCFALLRFLSILSCYLVLHVYLRQWFDRKTALLGAAFLGAFLPVTFVEWFEIPTDFLELLLVLLGFLCIVHGRTAALALVLFLATLNRETSGYLVMVYVAHGLLRDWPRLGRVVATGGLLSALWGSTYFALKWAAGVTRLHYLLDPQFLAENARGLLMLRTHPNPYSVSLSWFYLFNVFWLLAIVRLRSKPAFLRAAVLTVPVLLGLYLVAGGGLDEARELLLLVPVVLPAGLITLQDWLQDRPHRDLADNPRKHDEGAH
jgi:hypothetical protein